MSDKTLAIKPAAGMPSKLVKAHDALDEGAPGQARLVVKAEPGTYADAAWNLSLANRNADVRLAMSLEGGPAVTCAGVRWDLEYASLVLSGLRFERSKLQLRAVDEIAIRDSLFLDAVARGDLPETLYALRTGTPSAPRSVTIANSLFQGNRETVGSYMLSVVSMYENLPLLTISDSALVGNDTFCDVFVSGVTEVRLARCFLHKPPHVRQAREQSDKAYLLGVHNPWTKVVLEDCTLVGDRLQNLLNDQSQERAVPVPPPHASLTRCRVFVANGEGQDAFEKGVTLNDTTITVLKPEETAEVAAHLAASKPARPVDQHVVASLAAFLARFKR